ncbi:hypothetical protein B0T18DRAFT_401287 [Schizothecium vesticola]|uniref:Uncharacterized protein n=1 Tax=Schizothecium vesticola TaxID=314040 RepID=A0AA40F462_9PEZI|nr:hypothetical protein B0T18DRAFT_401287 [Schizothecium vesticola]
MWGAVDLRLLLVGVRGSAGAEGRWFLWRGIVRMWDAVFGVGGWEGAVWKDGVDEPPGVCGGEYVEGDGVVGRWGGCGGGENMASVGGIHGRTVPVEDETETEQRCDDCARDSGLACGRKSSSSLSKRSVGSVDFGIKRSRKRPNEMADAEPGLGERRRRSRGRGPLGVRSGGPGKPKDERARRDGDPSLLRPG